jgi:hypothetical protein
MSFESQYSNVSLKDSLQKYSFCNVLNLSTLSEDIEKFSLPHDPQVTKFVAKVKPTDDNIKNMNDADIFFIFYRRSKIVLIIILFFYFLSIKINQSC